MDYVTCKALNAGSDTVSCWTRSESSSMVVMVLAHGASGVATLVVSASIVKRGFQTGRNPVRTRMDILMISLLFANLLHALAGSLNIKWIIQGYSEVGLFCAVQGVLNQIGPVAVAINTIAIAIWTFVTIWSFSRVNDHLRPAWLIILAIWVVVFLVSAAPDLKYWKQEHRYWRPTPLWCTISKDYELARLFGKYIWFWIAFLSLILYLPLALLARGNLTRSRAAWLGFTIHRKPNEYRHRLDSVVYSMIAYPVSNAILIIPLSIVRWRQLTESRPIRTRDGIAVGTVFALNGLVNVLLLVYLRPGLFQGGEPAPTAPPYLTVPGSSLPTASGSPPPTPARAVGNGIVAVPRVTSNGDLEMVGMKSNDMSE